ncbi:hypothetical protein, partial [Enterococcus faecium]|uniref:hypothetical protein n=1 Tax=Enterococcus faecium TaxID=1352 RepID=UPI0034E97E19
LKRDFFTVLFMVNSPCLFMLAPPYSKTPHIDHGPQSLCTPAKEVTTKISFLYDTVLLPGTSCQTKVSAYNQNFICYQSKVFS